MSSESHFLPLAGSVALVTGASRGVGKGTAKALAQLGAKVYLTARSTDAAALVDGLGGSVHQTAAEIGALGGQCVPLPCDHARAEDIEQVFTQIAAAEGRLDILVNNAWAGYQGMLEQQDGRWVWTWELPFWEQPLWRYDQMMVSVRSSFVCSQLATRLMLRQPAGGLIVNVSFWAAQKHLGNAAYGVAKAATDKLTRDLAAELAAHPVTVVSLYPGLVRTEGVLRAGGAFDLSNSESPEYQGLAVAHLYLDARRKAKSGQVLLSAELGREYGFADVDGRQPRPLTLDEV